MNRKVDLGEMERSAGRWISGVVLRLWKEAEEDAEMIGGDGGGPGRGRSSSEWMCWVDMEEV